MVSQMKFGEVIEYTKINRMAKEYFSHDYGTRNKRKMAVLLHEEGCRGYGLFWVIVEMLHENPGFWLKINLDTIFKISDASRCDDTEYIVKFITNCCKKYEVFVLRRGWFTIPEFSKKPFNGKKPRLSETNPDLWQEIKTLVFNRDQYICQYCGQKGGLLECDHIVPFSKGGSNELQNLNTSCRSCNRKKYNKTIDEFKRKEGIK